MAPADPAAAVATGTDVRAAAVVLTLVLSTGSAFAGPVADTVDVVASERGFEPRVINVHKGEPVRLRLTTSDREHCFAIDALRVEKRIVPGKATILELTPGKAGTFPFSCCLETGAAAEKEHGRLVVVE